MLLLALYISCILTNLSAQTSRIDYRTIVKLNPGEEIDNLLTCWRPDEKSNPSQVVIRQPGGTFSTSGKTTSPANR